MKSKDLYMKIFYEYFFQISLNIGILMGIKKYYDNLCA